MIALNHLLNEQWRSHSKQTPINAIAIPANTPNRDRVSDEGRGTNFHQVIQLSSLSKLAKISIISLTAISSRSDLE